MMNDETLKTIGKLCVTDMPRDAIHVAVMQVIVEDNYVRAGEKVRLLYGTNRVREAHTNEDAHGVIDPFLDYLPVHKGDRVWMFLFPGMISSLRHNWECQEIDQPVSENEHEKWLHEFADKWNFDYNHLIQAGIAMNDMENFATARGIELHDAEELGEDHDLFWEHLEKLTQRTFPAEHRQRFTWSCSC